MSTEKLKEILENCVKNDTGTNGLNAAAELLSACKTEDLVLSINNFQRQLPLTISELRQTISNNTDKIIESSNNLSKSNEKYSKSMRWLTLALVFVGVIQVVVSIIIECVGQ